MIDVPPATGGGSEAPMMRAIRVEAFGGPEQLKLVELPVPEPGAGQVRVRLHAAGVNPVDTYVRAGTYARKPPLPFTPGTDGAGVVEAVGADVRGLATGDRVYVAALLRSHTGTYAECVVCDASAVHPLPGSVSFAAGAGVGVPYVTAHRALFQRAGLKPGERVLVHGASGGVGTAALQMARAHGAVVVGTAGSEAGLELVRSEGAHLAADHTAAGYADRIVAFAGGFDVVVEMLANVNLERDLQMLAPRGRVVIVGNRGTLEFNPRSTMAKEATVMGTMLWNASPEEDASAHAAVVAGLESGVLRPVVGRQLSLADAPRAHEHVLERGSYGKIVLVP